jgi:methionyl-tRNA formyltransferase
MQNVHFSLLPRWRGAAPVERAILAGDEETGVSIMTLDADLDTGPVHLERRIEVGAQTFATLLGDLSVLGARALTEVLASRELLEHPVAQVGEATYAAKLTKEDHHLSALSSVVQNLRIVRLGKAFVVVEGRRLIIERAVDFEGEKVDSASISVRAGRVVLGVSDGAIELLEVRPESAKSMSAVAWWTGARFDQNVARWT